MKKTILIAVFAAFVAVALVLAMQWRVRSERAPVAPVGATQARAEHNRPDVGESPTPSASSPPPAAQDPDAPPGESIAPQEDFASAVARIDPSLIGQNLIQRARGAANDGPSFIDVEARYSAESVDPNWSDGMEARILAQVAQVPNLGLASIETECRQTTCRVKLFYPPGTNALSALEKLRPIARQIGFAHVVEVATLGDQGVPVSLLYFQRDDA